MTQQERKRYEGVIDGLVIKQTKNGADYVEVKLLRERMQYPDTCRGFDEDIVALMRDVPLGSYAMLLIDESPGSFNGKPITNRNIAGYEAIGEPTGNPAVEDNTQAPSFNGEPEQPPLEDGLFGNANTSGTVDRPLPTKPSAPTPYVSSDERRQASIERQVAFKEAVQVALNTLGSIAWDTGDEVMLTMQKISWYTDTFEAILQRTYTTAEEDGNASS